MSRPLRVEMAGGVYHVTSRGDGREDIFLDDGDRQQLLAVLRHAIDRFGWRCPAYCLMTNHYHLLLETPAPNLARGMRQLNGIYTQRFNRRYGRVGHVFQGRYKALVVQKDRHLLELCRYVVLNPVRAGMVKRVQDWPWSSYRATAGVEAVPPWLTVDWVLGQFGRTRGPAHRAYQQFVAEGQARQIVPWEQVRGQIYLGRTEFLQQVQQRVGGETRAEIPVGQQQPGRPTLAAIVGQIAHGYGQREAELRQWTRRPSEARQVAVYAARRIAGSDLRSIGRYFGLSYPAVSRRVQAVGAALDHDVSFRQRVERMVGVIDTKVKT